MISKKSRESSPFSKMPKATTEQLNLAKLLNKSSDEVDFQFRIQTVQECTACSLEEAISALHDSDNLQSAIESVLDTSAENDSWQSTTHKKSKSRRPTEQTFKSKSTKEVLPESHKEVFESFKDEEELVVFTKVTSEMKKGQSFRRQGNKNRSEKVLLDKLENSTPTNRKAESVNISEETDSKHFPINEKHDSWAGECGDWKGEAIEIVNSTSDFPINIHEDTELFKLATTEPELVEESPRIETPKLIVEETPMVSKLAVLNSPVKESLTIESSATDEEPINSAKSQLFAKFSNSKMPEASCIPRTAVFFAPGSKATTTPETTYSFGYDLVQSSDPLHDHTVQQSVEQHTMGNHERNPEQIQTHYETSAEELRLKSSNQCNYTPVANPVQTPAPKQLIPEVQGERSYPSALQNVSVLKDAFVKLQERESPRNRAPVNSFESPDSFNSYLLDELSQNINKASIDVRSNKTDAFTQSLSSNQPDAISPSYHSVQSIKPTVSQPQIGKPILNMPLNTNQQSMSAAQSHPQMHQTMPPSVPQLLNQFQTAFPMFNLQGNTGATPQLLDFDQLQAMQQQRFLYEMQQQSQQPQANSPEQNMLNSCSDVMSSSKSTTSMNHVTTANTAVRPDFLASTMNHHQMMNPAAAAPFLPYPGFVFMNGYPNPFLNQHQASQPSGSHSQSSGHGGSPLTQHQSAQQQYVKGINSTANYPNYQGMRQSNFDDLNDLSYSNMKQGQHLPVNLEDWYQIVGYKQSGNQAVYGSQQGQPNPEMSSLSSKLQQQQTGSMSQNLGVSQQQQQAANQYQHSGGGGPANHFNFYQQQYMAMAAVAAAAAQQQHQQQQQQQHSVTNTSNGGGGISSNGLVTNSQMPGGSIGSGMHGSAAMTMGGGQPGMHHQRPQH